MATWCIALSIACLTLTGWPECRQQVPWIAKHFWGTWDELSIDATLCLKGIWVCIPPELLNCNSISIQIQFHTFI